jgi:hypothetical protein
MLILFSLVPAFAGPLGSLFTDHLPAFQIAGALDLAGLVVAIWTFWSTIQLSLGGKLLRAFRLMTVGSLAFALSHLADTLLQASRALDVEVATFLHQGVVSVAIFLFVAGLANLTDDLPMLGTREQPTPSMRLWPIVVGGALCISALSFVLYGFSLVAETWAFIWIDIGLIIMLGVCLLLALRARLGGSIGHSLWLAMLGLFIFGMAHPVQIWFYLNTTLSPGTLAIVHRLVVIPAFYLFAISITRLGQQVDRTWRAQKMGNTTDQIRPVTNLHAEHLGPRQRPHLQ